MGRIDDALRRVSGETEGASLPAPAQSADTEVFSSPWSFTGETAERTEPVTPPPPPAVPAEATPRLPASAHVPDPVLIQRFSAQLTGRIVSGPGVSPRMAEQYRRLAATLHHSQLVQGTRVIMLTSANPGDGKSLTAANLALTLSESYRREVLLVDADLRRPTLHEVFGAPNVEGLNEGLHARREGKLSVLKLSERLTLLPAGRPDPDPMSTLTSPRMADILRESAQRFDWVIVDTPPLGLLADAHLLSTLVDGAVLVIRAGRTPYVAVEKAIESLGRERILGVVLNAAPDDALDPEYGSYYGTSKADAQG